ncbi:ScbA/BarX family gamma-butyrolactone biosynthesis protein [Actinophytocola xanthii]|uniref:A-factor biosynthesis hotdog domain-containing protein n=1 Tax=Actinophytocola xanthii TaxID=1912961 RepID=A0A1Q8C6G5_9PSEU|nr:ScbA/BarX family gamma-butyrolactone biosynthesis protein [Actinophytocola xanthii]OLF09955.1 hypothetical protein BU204_32260 [Actinophytocola xanthii]
MTVPVVVAADLSFESTVPRAMVHRHAVSEVFLTDSARLSESEYLVAAHLPTTHAFFGDLVHNGHADPQFFVEVSRQACVLLAHRYYGVPRGYGFVFRRSTTEVVDRAALRLSPSPARVVLRVEVRDVEYRQGTAHLMDLALVAEVDDRPAIRFTGTQLMLPRETFAVLRAAHTARLVPGRQDGPPLHPGRVGRTDPRNVVLSPGPAEGVFELVVDQTHPVFFDHPQDHVPGLLLVEAFQQAAFAALGPEPAPELVSLDLAFDRFVELGVTVRVHTEVAPGAGPRAVAVRLVQAGDTAATATVRVR